MTNGSADEAGNAGKGASWQRCFSAPAKAPFEAALAARLPAFRWFAAKARVLRTVTLAEAIPLDGGDAADAGAAGDVRGIRGTGGTGGWLLLLHVTHDQVAARPYPPP